MLLIDQTRSWCIISIILLCACSSNRHSGTPADPSKAQHPDSLKFSVEAAPEWTNLFKRYSGWFGGDGIFVIPHGGNDTTPADTSTIVFSDTMIGEIADGKPKPGFAMIHNSVATLTGNTPGEENISFYYDKGPDGKPEALFIPATPSTKPGDYYWLGDGFVNTELNGNTYIFGYRIKNVPVTTGFGFEQVGNTLIILPKRSRPPYKDQRQMDIPFFVGGNDSNSMSFGSGVLVNTKAAGAIKPDGYVYVYGVKGTNKNLVVSRVASKDFERPAEWQFWDGSHWIAEMSKVAGITDHVSNELSVSPLPDGRYVLFFQVDGISSTIGLRVGSSPVGPFGPIIKVYDCSADLVGKKIYAYNAKAHPALSGKGELLVSYNVNSFDFENDIRLYPNLYRPRFIRVKWL